jgi:hypothetical protein
LQETTNLQEAVEVNNGPFSIFFFETTNLQEAVEVNNGPFSIFTLMYRDKKKTKTNYPAI